MSDLQREALEKWMKRIDQPLNGQTVVLRSMAHEAHNWQVVWQACAEANQLEIEQLRVLLADARDDVASCMDDAKLLLPYKPNRYEAYVKQLADIDHALNKPKANNET